MNINAQDYLAKLLAKENLTVQHGNYTTASFDVVGRTLKLPLWADKGKAVYDLLVGHEVGHALYTPPEGWHDAETQIPGVPRAYINIIEDIRIEKKVQRTYPGIVRSFKLGYKRLFDDNLFGTEGKDVSTYKFMDRLNIFSKGRGYSPVEFTEVEQRFVDLAMGVETWDDVLTACREINDFIKNNEDYNEDPEPTETETTITDEDMSGESLDEIDGDSESGEGDEIDENNGDTLTDDSQRENEGSLLDTDDAGKQNVYSSGLSKEDVDKMIITYDHLKQARLDRASDLYNDPEIDVVYAKFIKNTKATVNLMVKDFERKKAAWEYSRSSEAKKGSLNVNKLHQYQYSEDIFLTVQQLAQAKSHGIFMLIDQSGSMQYIYKDVITQVIIIALFCKRVNIPFEAHTYTSHSHYGENSSSDLDTNDLYGRNTKVVNIFSSSMKKSVLHEALKMSLAVSLTLRYSHDNSFRYEDVCSLDRFGSTPTVQALIATEELLKRFKAKHPVQNVNLMLLTDGSSDELSVKNTYMTSAKELPTNNTLTFKLGRKLVTGTTRAEIVENTLKTIKSLRGVKTTGFFLTNGRRSEFEDGWMVFNLDDTNDHDKALKAWKTTGVASIKNTSGFNDFFIIKTDAGVDGEEFEVKENKQGDVIKFKDVRRQFRNFNKKKKQGKVLVSKITDAIAISA